MVVEPLVTQMAAQIVLCLMKIEKRGHEVGGDGEVRLDLARVKQKS